MTRSPESRRRRAGATRRIGARCKRRQRTPRLCTGEHRKMRGKLGLPERLLILATGGALYGTSRLHSSAHSSHPPLDVRRLLVVWYVLLAGGICVWLLSALHLW